MARRGRVRFETGRSRNSARVAARNPPQRDPAAAREVLRENAKLLEQRRQRDSRPRVVQPKLPKAESLTEADLARLEAAARRQLDRNRRRIEGTSP